MRVYLERACKEVFQGPAERLADQRMSTAHAQGPSFVRWEPPDIIYGEFIGDISGEEMRRIMHESIRFTKDRPNVFGMLDVSRIGEVTPEARAVAREYAGQVRLRASTVIGARFQYRVLALLINKATALLGRAKSRPLYFFDSEAEARAWVAEARKTEGPLDGGPRGFR